MEPSEKSKLGRVPDRIGSRVRTCRQHEADCGTRQGEVPHRDVLDLVPLHPGKRRVVDTNRVSRSGQAQPAALPGTAQVCSKEPGESLAQLERAIPRAFTARHEDAISPAPITGGSYERRYDAAVRLVDSHCHLNAERFAGEEAAVLDRAQAAGVERILVPGWNLASSERAIGLVEQFAGLDGAVGVHPHDAAKVDDAGWRRIVELAAHPRVAAIGETGLVYDRVFSPIPDQLANLRRNLRLALDIGKPAILHVRSAAGRSDAQDAILAELCAAGFGGPAATAAFGTGRPPAVIHSFSGSVDYARQVLDLGLAISVSGLAFRTGEESTSDVVPLVSADRLLVETDSPFLSPPGAPRGRNEPEWVRITADWVADRRAVDPADVGDGLVAAYDTFVGRAAS